MAENSKENKVKLYKYWRVFELVLAVIYVISAGSVVAIVQNPEWHNHILNLLKRSWDIFVAQDVGSTSRGFLSGSMDAVFSIFTVAIMIGYLHGFKEFKKHIAETAITALLAIPTVTAFVYGTQFAWEMAKTANDEQMKMHQQIASLKEFSDREDEYRHKLANAEAKASKWQTDYLAISKGEVVPDRNLDREEMDQLHDKLKDYAKRSGDKKYSTVRIGPAFADNLEATHLAEQLLKVFHGAEWTLKSEFEHDKRLLPLLHASNPGVVIFTDDPHNQGIWIMWALKDAGIDSSVAYDTPPWFKGTLICIAQKQRYEQIQW